MGGDTPPTDCSLAVAAKVRRYAERPYHKLRAVTYLWRTSYNVERSLMLVTALSPVIGYDKASAITHHALDHTSR